MSLGILAWILRQIPLSDHRWRVVGRDETPAGVTVTLRDGGGTNKTLTLRRFDAQVGQEWVERGFPSQAMPAVARAEQLAPGDPEVRRVRDLVQRAVATTPDAQS